MKFSCICNFCIFCVRNFVTLTRTWKFNIPVRVSCRPVLGGRLPPPPNQLLPPPKFLLTLFLITLSPPTSRLLPPPPSPSTLPPPKRWNPAGNPAGTLGSTCIAIYLREVFTQVIMHASMGSIYVLSKPCWPWALSLYTHIFLFQISNLEIRKIYMYAKGPMKNSPNFSTSRTTLWLFGTFSNNDLGHNMTPVLTAY